MATTIKTVMTYPLDGSTTDFNIPFEYLARKFVRVTLIGVDRKELILNQDYRFATKTTISTTRVLGPADGYNLIEIRRYTSATERLVDFTDGSILRAYDLNISQVQTLHVAEEARDLTADTIGVNNDGNLDARGRRIVNVADAKDPGDVITLGQVSRWNESALNSANAAKVSENNAKASEIRSGQAETRSVQAETRSVTAETNSKNSEAMAQKWAANPLGEIVANNMFSSFHYANQANLSAGAAKTSENNSASSASASAASAASSKNEADRAKREADKLGNMNQLSESIESVTAPVGDTTGKVVWGYDMDVKNYIRAYAGMSLGKGWDGKGSSPFFNFYRGQDEPSGSLRLDANKVVRFNGMNSVDFDSTINAQAINGSWIHSTGDLVADNTLYVHGGEYIIKDKWVPNGVNKTTNLIRGSVGGFTCDEQFNEIVGRYIERVWHLVGGGNDMWMNFKGNGNFEIGGNRGARIVLNGGAVVESDGNIRGAAWDGKWLKDFMEERYLTNIWIGAGRSQHVGETTWDGWVDNGCVLRGIKQIHYKYTSFIEELHFNELWKATARGQWII